MFSQKKKSDGFTLIELVIVLAIAGILVALAVPNYFNYLAKSQQAEAKENLGAIYAGMLAYTAPKALLLEGFLGATLENIGFTADGMARYSYRLVFITTNTFRARAIGGSGQVNGDVWEIDQNGEMNDLDKESFNR